MESQAVLLVEDDEKLNEINRRGLEHGGYLVYTALNLAQAREWLSRTDPDVILLDVTLPDGDGFDFCDEIRKKTDAHILFLTSKRKQAEKLLGLTLGGDDYITKPFYLSELLLKIEAIMRRRRVEKSPAQTLQKGSLTLNIAAAQAAINGKDLILTPKEFFLLLALAQNEDKILIAEELYEKVWNAPLAGDKNALQVAVSKLRQKIEHSEYTITVNRGQGYIFERK